MAKGDVWLYGDGWLGRWVAKLVALLLVCYGSFLGSNPDIYQKVKMGNINNGVANTL